MGVGLGVRAGVGLDDADRPSPPPVSGRRSLSPPVRTSVPPLQPAAQSFAFSVKADTLPVRAPRRLRGQPRGTVGGEHAFADALTVMAPQNAVAGVRVTVRTPTPQSSPAGLRVGGGSFRTTPDVAPGGLERWGLGTPDEATDS